VHEGGHKSPAGSFCCPSVLTFLVIVLGILLAAPFAGAQSTGGRIRGTVTDPSGGAVATALF
jgi:hypothetical protein